MARGRSGPVVSLFAFQDIITSVSGILIVVVLLMALELVERPEADAAAPTADVHRLTGALRSAKSELESLQQRLAAEADVVEAASETSAGELDRQIAEYESELERLGSQLEELKSDAEVLDAAAASLEVKEFDAAKELAAIEQLRRRAQELRDEVEATRNDDRVVFVLPKGINKAGWLVVLSGDGIASAPIGVAARPTLFSAGRSSAADFLAWASSRRADYFLLLILPTGIDNFDIVEEDFRDSGVAYGFDVIGEQLVVLHPERGAAP